jgi:hypothetical protein
MVFMLMTIPMYIFGEFCRASGMETKILTFVAGKRARMWTVRRNMMEKF